MKVTVKQILELQVEIVGAKSDNLKITGLLNEKLNMKTKFWLQELLKKVAEKKESYAEVEKSLFVSLGAVEEESGLVIPFTLEDGSDNPAIKALDVEREKLLNEEVDLGEFKFNINDFDFESESNYYTFMSVAFE